MGLLRGVIEKRSSARYRVDGKRGLVWITALATLLWLSPAYGRTVIENFDNGQWDPNLFIIAPPPPPPVPFTVTVVNEQLQVQFSGATYSGLFSGGLEMLGNWQLVGNFDIQVDFNLAAWPSDSGAWPANSGMGAGIVSTLFDVRRVASKGQPNLINTYSFGIPGGSIQNVNTGDTSGKLRLKRTGSTVQAFFWNATVSPPIWQSIGNPVTAQKLAAPTSVYIGVEGGGFTVTPPLTVNFDNLSITITSNVIAALQLLSP